MEFPFKDQDYERLAHMIKNLDRRLKRIEAHLDLETGEESEDVPAVPAVEIQNGSDADALEFQIGQFWFAQVGIVILAIGIAFLLTFPYPDFPAIVPSLFGYFVVGLVFLLSYLWRHLFSHISRYLLGAGMILLYFTTLRLFYFSVPPAFDSKTLEIILLSSVVIINFTIAFKKRSAFLSSISLTLAYLAVLLSGSAYFIFLSVTFLAAFTVFIKRRWQWDHVFIYGIFLTYLTHFLWFINNPFLGNKVEFVSAPQANIFFILIYSVIYGLANLFRQENKNENSALITATLLNSIAVYSFFLLLTLTKFNSSLTTSHLLAAFIFLLFSILFWIRQKSKYATFFYAITGYMALSIAITSQFERPDFFVWLNWQSVLVISTAVWFRSKFIIVANFFIFLIIFITYLSMESELSLVSLGFGIVALLSARILNWQKHRLELKTELMRNAYLGAAFLIFPYTLYKIVPGGYVILAWLAVALLYYLLSLTLKNNKYRWMAVLTILLTVLYVFIIGIIKLEGVYRIVSFLALGIILIGLSLVYSRIKSRQEAK